VTEAAEALDEEHHGRNPRAGDLRRVVQRPARHPVHLARDLLDGLRGELDQVRVERTRLDPPLRRPLDAELLLRGNPVARCLRVGDHTCEPVRLEVALIEDELTGRRDRGHDSARRVDHAHGRHRAGLERDLTPLEHEARGAGDGVAAEAHRRGTDMGPLPHEADGVALDAVRAEDDPERDAEVFEHRPLLDVKLEVRGRVGELPRGVERAVEVDAEICERAGERHAVRVAQPPEVVRSE